METNFEHIILKEELRDSQVYREAYGEIMEYGAGSLNTPIFKETTDILANIFTQYNSLSQFQKDVLNNIFLKFDEIRKAIDPNRLKNFSHAFTDDDELLLYRRSEKGLTNIIIDSEELISYSFIPTTDIGERVLLFYSIESDFEKLAYSFFSN